LLASFALRLNAQFDVVDRLEITAGSIDITPKYEVALAGWEGRTEGFESVADSLEINAILLRGQGVAALVLSMDVLYVGSRFESALRRKLEQAGLEGCFLLTAASHTHFAPSLDATKPALGECDEQYCEYAEGRAEDLVEMLIAAPAAAAHLRYASGRAEHSVNRRRLSWQLSGRRLHRAVQMRANPGGPNDQTIHVVRFDGADGRPQTVLWSYACHPVAFPRPLDVTAEFPGVVRQALRDRFGPDLPVIFLQGFSGDLRPPATIEAGRHPGRRIGNLFQGAPLGRFSEAGYECWSRSLAETVATLASSVEFRELAPALRHRTVSLPLSRLIEGDGAEQTLSVARLELADDLQLFTLSAEVVAEYGHHLRKVFPEVHTIPVGCVGDVFGYLPTANMVREGGYEAEDFFRPFSLTGQFRPSLEETTVDVMIELSDNVPARTDPETAIRRSGARRGSRTS
jgi:hypothetical protein